MDAKPSKRRPTRSGFTLVELLVVIIIISMLAGMLAVALPAAIRAAKRMVICSEINQLSMAFENYKSDYGDYPPDCFNVGGSASAQQAVLQHFRKRFNRYRPGAHTTKVTGNNLSGVSDWNKLRLDAYNSSISATITNPSSINSSSGLDLNTLDPSSALAFFLGGMPDSDGKPSGFSANPNNPFAIGGSRIDPLFGLDETRYIVTNYVPKYYPKYITNPGNSSEGVPYVYFRPRSGAYGPRTFGDIRNDTTPIPRYPLTPNTDYGICLPYSRTTINSTILGDTSKYPNSKTVDWYVNKKFQIIAAGLDGQFGTTDTPFDPTPSSLEPYRYFNPDDNNLKSSEDDNLTSFTPGRLEDGAQ